MTHVYEHCSPPPSKKGDQKDHPSMRNAHQTLQFFPTDAQMTVVILMLLTLVPFSLLFKWR